jgi:LysM repeat protein
MIVVDAGHGGPDPGSVGNGIIEKDLNLLISNYMYDRFQELNIPVVATRTTDEELSPTDRVDRIMSAYGNNKDVIVISNHINAGGGDGAEVIYALRNNSILSNLILEEISKEGQNIRKAYQRRLPSDTSKDYYFIHRDTGITQPVIVEYGFLDSPGDDVSQLKNNWKDYAEAVVRAVTIYLNRPYIPVEGVTTYTVQKGDSLWSIAQKFNTTVDELKRVNNLTTTALNVGQILKLPTEIETENYITYTVKAGDNLYSIARAYNISVTNLIEFNNLPSTSLSIGQQLLIPVEEEIIEIIEPTEYIEHIVKSGESLYSIGKKYGYTATELMQYNNLSSNLLSLGQVLRIPNIITEVTYTVKPGDSLYSIARTYNTSVDEIKIKNNLTSNLLNIGQVLII